MMEWTPHEHFMLAAPSILAVESLIESESLLTSAIIAIMSLSLLTADPTPCT